MSEHHDSPNDATSTDLGPTDLGDAESCCPEWEPRLLELLLDELGGERRQELEDHLEICPECSAALVSARVGLSALGSLDQPPLPFGDPLSPREGALVAAGSRDQKELRSQAAWDQFVQQRLNRPRRPSSVSSGWRLLAAASLLLLGFGLGRFPTAAGPSEDSRADSRAAVAETALTRVSTDSIAALARAELLADLGIGYVYGLQDAVVEVLALEIESLDPTALAGTRERARDLIRDGRFLRRTLDTDLDEKLLVAIDRAELLLEEMAALGTGSAGTDVVWVQRELRSSDLQNQLADLGVEHQVDLAIAASGQLGAESS